MEYMYLALVLFIAFMSGFFVKHFFAFKTKNGITKNIINCLKNEDQGEKDSTFEGSKKIIESFYELIDNGFIKSLSDFDKLKEWLYEKLQLEVPMENYVLAGLFGTFCGLIFAFYFVSKSGDLSQLFKSATFAFFTSIFGIFFYMILYQRNISLNRRINELYLYMEDYAKKNVTPSISASLNRGIKKIEKLLVEIKNLPDSLGPVTDKLSGVVNSFEEISNSMVTTQKESIKTQRELKESLETMNNQYNSILNRIDNDVIEKEQLLKYIETIEKNLNTINTMTQGVTSLYSIFEEKLNNLINILQMKLEDINSKLTSTDNTELLLDIKDKISSLNELINKFSQEELPTIKGMI
ncbi:MAG: hypothetical protein J7L71_03550, partial [Spirochaetaceae bacterium]|nr:hypothetical protein [Spirochaetaceae bacterium]